jgi:hypothetical protein
MTRWGALAAFALLVACSGSTRGPGAGERQPDGGTTNFLGPMGREAGTDAGSPSDAGPHGGDASKELDGTTTMGAQDAASAPDTSVHDAAPIDAAGYTSLGAAAPQVQTLGGPTLTAPSVVPIYFANDSLQAEDDQFLQGLPTSSYWSTIGPEYGIGAITVLPSIVVTDTPPTTIADSQVATFLAGYISGASPGWPAFSPSTIYTIYYPASTTVTLEGITSCQGFLGYHSESTLPDGTPFVYAVIVRCANVPGGIDIDNDTGTVSHELYEASTDPHPFTNPAYLATDPNHLIWEDEYPLSELGDMCADMPQSFQRLVGNFLVQRMWSNKQAASGNDPCVPQLAQPYYNAVPELTDTVTIAGEPTEGVIIPVGQTVTINVLLFAAAPTPDWGVELLDVSSSLFSGPTLLSFSPSTFTGNNGDVVPVQVTAVATDAMLGGAEMALVSLPTSGTSTVTYANLWFGFVQN